MLRMNFSKEGKKWVSFSDQMSALGVTLDISNCANGSVFFKHTESRKAEFNETLDRHLNEGTMTSNEAWFESFLFGRLANLALHIIGKRATSNSACNNLGTLEFFKDRVVNGPPIEICAAAGEVLFVFSDGPSKDLQTSCSCDGRWSAFL